jgi:hypothetical protein
MNIHISIKLKRHVLIHFGQLRAFDILCGSRGKKFGNPKFRTMSELYMV